MRFGFQLMLRGAGISPEGITAIAVKGESLGFDVLSINDHILVPDGIDSTYPYTSSGVWPGASIGECHEQLTALAFIAGQTKRIKILTSVMVVPYRAPVLTAKIIASADVLSNGRVILGCGAGWMAEEVEAIGGPPFSERGKATDEYLSIFKELWTAKDPTFVGQFASFSDIHFEPSPVQKPHPPIWIGGESIAALRRTARFGDAWYPASNNPRYRILDADSLGQRIEVLNDVCHQEARDPAEIDIAYFYTGAVASEERFNQNGERLILTGKADSIAEDIAKFEKLGLHTMVFVFQQPSLSETIEQMEWFGGEVLPLFK